MTPVDALDTMMLMDLKDEARSTREYIATHLSFNKDIEVQNFEITIRLLGGLLSSYQLSGDQRLLKLAEDLGNRLLPAFNSPTGLPYRYVNLKNGKVRGNVTNPAEAGTLLIEFGTLSKLTHKKAFYDKAKRALVEIFNRRSPIGLVGTWINVETGQWTDPDSHISGAIDSYYEYLLKCAILFGDEDCRRMWEASIVAIDKYLAVEAVAEAEGSPAIRTLWYGHADMNTGKRTANTYGALDAFFPAVLSLWGNVSRAQTLQESSYRMWKQNGIEPEEFDFQTMKVTSPGYALRPEIVESTYYLYHYAVLGTLKHRPLYSGPFRLELPDANNSTPPLSGTTQKLDPEHYQTMGQTMWRDFVKYCRSDAGYAALKSVITKEQTDSMPSYLFAETFKYFYLLFAEPRTLDFENVIFNTEAHPIRRPAARR